MLGKKIAFLLTTLILIFVVISTDARDQQVSTGERIMDFYAIHRQTKQPLAEVTITVRVSADNYKKQKSWDETTDSKGFCRIKLPDYQIETLRLYPRKEGFVPLFIMWRGIPTPPELPKVFTVTMEPSTTIGGVVRDESGEPIEGVTVGVHYQTPDPDAAENVYVDVMIHNARSTDTVTDEAGRWAFNEMPAEIDKNKLRIFLKHPRYLSDSPRPGFIPMPITRQPSIEGLRDFSAVMVMKEGFKVTGKITDKGGKPIAGAKIYDTDNYWFRSTKPVTESDAQGQFQSNANPGTATWTVQAPGYAPDLRVITIKAGMPPVEFRLEPGRTIEGKVADQAGKPIEGATISAEDWRQSRRRLHLVAKTDTEGNFKVTDAPSDEVTFDIGQHGYMLLENYPMKPGQRKYDITLRPTLKVRGTVLDTQTGRPIDKFTVTNGFDHEDGRAPQWDKHSIRTFTGGRYEMEYRQEIFTYRLRIDAEGYQSAISDCIRPSEISESNFDLDFKLDRATAFTGTVLAPDGAPLSGIDVVIATHRLQISNGTYDSHSSEQNRIFQTGANGQFRFEPPVSPYVIVVLGEQGFARVTPHDFKMSQIITLTPWGRIVGTLRIGSQPGADKLVAFLHNSRSQMEQPRTNLHYETRTDKNGHFSFTRAFPGEGVVTRAIPMDNRGRRFSHSVSVEVKSGETTRVQIGGTGRPIVGKVVIPDLIEDTFDWQHVDHGLRVSSPNSPYRILALNIDEKENSFRTDDVPAGDYTVYVAAYSPPPNSRTFRGERIGILSRAFTIPEMPGGRSDEPFNLGELELEVVGKSAFIPSLVGKPLPDLNGLNLTAAPAQANNKMILICFWDMNQRPSRNCLLQLSSKAQELMAKDVVVIAIQASITDENKLNEWVKRNNLTFPVGMIRTDEENVRFAWGVRALPWLILTDKNHVIISEGFAIEALDEKMSQIQ